MTEHGSARPIRHLSMGIIMAIVLLGVLLPFGPRAPAARAGAQQSAPEATGTAAAPTIAIVQQDPWVGPRGEVRIQVEVQSEPAAGLTIRVFDAVRSRSEVLSPPATPTTRQLSTLEPVSLPGGRQRVTVRIPVVPEADGTFGNPLVLDPGVFPVRLEVVESDGRRRAGVTTNLVRLPEVIDPHPMTLVVPVHADPDRGSDGRTTVDQETRAAFDRRLATIATAPTVPVTLALTPETANALASDRSGAGSATLQRIAALVRSGTEVVASPFVRLDVGSWYRPDGVGVLNAELDLGRATLDAGGLGTVAESAALGDRFTDDLVTYLAGRGLRRLLVPADAVAGAAWPLAPAHTASTPQMVVVAATPVGEGVAGNPVLAAYRTLAALAWGLTEGAVPPSSGWALRLAADPSTDGSYLRTLLDVLGRPGPFQATTLSRFSSSAPSTARSTVTWRALLDDELDSLPVTLSTAAGRLAAVGTMVGELPLLVRARGLLLVAASRDVSEDTRRNLLAGIEETARSVVGVVTLPRDESIAVTSHRVRLPVVIRYDGPTPVDIAVSVRSSELEIEGPNPLRIELTPGANDLEIPIRSRRSGEFELEIQATSPDGVLVLGTTRLTVRSRAISGVGLLLSVGALVFLVLWWSRNHRRRQALRPPRRSADLPESPDSTTEGDDSSTMVGGLARLPTSELPRPGSERPVP